MMFDDAISTIVAIGVGIAFSNGIDAMSSNDDHSLELLLSRADKVLYRVKAGRGGYGLADEIPAALQHSASWPRASVRQRMMASAARGGDHLRLPIRPVAASAFALCQGGCVSAEQSERGHTDGPASERWDAG
jgi:hypothetical protein